LPPTPLSRRPFAALPPPENRFAPAFLQFFYQKTKILVNIYHSSDGIYMEAQHRVALRISVICRLVCAQMPFL